VFDEYRQFVGKYGDLVTKLPTRAFLAPLKEDEEVEVQLSKGTSAVIRFKAVGELQINGKREVFFEANGVPRWVAGRAVVGPPGPRAGAGAGPAHEQGSRGTPAARPSPVRPGTRLPLDPSTATHHNTPPPRTTHHTTPHRHHYAY
jgi:hypothetical protein